MQVSVKQAVGYPLPVLSSKGSTAPAWAVFFPFRAHGSGTLSP